MPDITDYRELTDDEKSEINRIKDMEVSLATYWRNLQNATNGDGSFEVDKRWAAIAKTHFQEGFTALCRAIARPDDPFEN